MSRVPATAVDELQGEVLAPLYRPFALGRIRVVPFVFVLMNLLFLGDAAQWRRWVLAAGFLAALLYSLFDYRRLQRDGFGRVTVARNVVFFVIVMPTVLLVSGGLEGPFVAIVIAMTLFLNVLIGGRPGLAFAGFVMAVIWALAFAATRSAIPDLIPTALGGGARGGHTDLMIYTNATVLSLLTIWATAIGRLVRTLFVRMTARAVEARDQALQAHQEHSRALTTLTGEIAHELKNPLASVKGLAALIAKDVEGRPAERLAVLRREVDRMQEVLEQFLNYSRPLVPISDEESDLLSICQAVTSLHEGFAFERGVKVVSREEASVRLRCDPRKVRQILINLLQNAIDAAPAGSVVELFVEPRPGGGTVTVLDRGPGLDPAVAARVFEPGVTTKPSGSGLGLAIARQLARQHGGDLRLLPRDGGGTMAELVLPRTPLVGALP